MCHAIDVKPDVWAEDNRISGSRSAVRVPSRDHTKSNRGTNGSEAGKNLKKSFKPDEIWEHLEVASTPFLEVDWDFSTRLAEITCVDVRQVFNEILVTVGCKDGATYVFDVRREHEEWLLLLDSQPALFDSFAAMVQVALSESCLNICSCAHNNLHPVSLLDQTQTKPSKLTEQSMTLSLSLPHTHTHTLYTIIFISRLDHVELAVLGCGFLFCQVLITRDLRSVVTFDAQGKLRKFDLHLHRQHQHKQAEAELFQGSQEREIRFGQVSQAVASSSLSLHPYDSYPVTSCVFRNLLTSVRSPSSL